MCSLRVTFGGQIQFAGGPVEKGGGANRFQFAEGGANWMPRERRNLLILRSSPVRGYPFSELANWLSNSVRRRTPTPKGGGHANRSCEVVAWRAAGRWQGGHRQGF